MRVLWQEGEVHGEFCKVLLVRIQLVVNGVLITDFSFLKNIGVVLRGNRGNYYIKGSHHRLIIPEINRKLALFLGLMYGDGCISSREIAIKTGDWRISIVEDDKKLLLHIKNLVKNLFGIDVRVFIRQNNTYQVFFSSRVVYEFLNKKFGFPDGTKKGRLRVPIQIFKSTSLIDNFLSGLFSTDGTFYISDGYPRLSFSSADYIFAKEINELLILRGFSPKINEYRRRINDIGGGNKIYNVRLNKTREIYLFHKKINFVGDKEGKIGNFINSPVV